MGKKIKKTKPKAKPKPKLKAVKQSEWVEVKRSQLHAPDYNPRKIEKGAADKLRKQIREDSLVDTLVVNKRTMNIVGGNQRTVQLDQIMKYKPGETDYKINVQMIDVDELTEIKINSRLNNPDAMGEYDAEKLVQIMSEFDIDPLKDLNFDRLTFDFFLSESGMDILGAPNPMEATLATVDKVREATQNPDGPSMQDIKKRGIEAQGQRNEEGTSEYMEYDDYIVTVVFDTNTEKREFMERLGKPRKEKFIKAVTLRDALKPEYL